MDIEKIALKLQETTDKAARNEGRIEKLEKRQDDLDELVGTVKVLATREERMEADVTEIKADVKEIAGKSGKRWDAVVEKVALTFAAAIVGYLLSKFGIG